MLDVPSEALPFNNLFRQLNHRYLTHILPLMAWKCAVLPGSLTELRTPL